MAQAALRRSARNEFGGPRGRVGGDEGNSRIRACLSGRETFLARSEIYARLEGNDRLAGNWCLRELVETRELVGVKVEAGTKESGENFRE